MQHILLKKDPKAKTADSQESCLVSVCVYALPGTVGSVDLAVTEFQIVMFIMSIKSIFLAVDLSFICLFLLSSRETLRAYLHLVWLPGFLHLRANFKCEVVTVWWMRKTNIKFSRETRIKNL